MEANKLVPKRPLRSRSASLPILNVLFSQPSEQASPPSAAEPAAPKSPVWNRRASALVPPLDTFDVAVAEEYKRQVRAEIFNRKLERAALALEDELQQTVQNFNIGRAAVTPVANTYCHRDECPCNDGKRDSRCLVGHGIAPLSVRPSHEAECNRHAESAPPRPARRRRPVSFPALSQMYTGDRVSFLDDVSEAQVTAHRTQQGTKEHGELFRPNLRLYPVGPAAKTTSGTDDAAPGAEEELRDADSATASLHHGKSKQKLKSESRQASASSNEPVPSGKLSSSSISRAVPGISDVVAEEEQPGQDSGGEHAAPPPIPERRRPRASSAGAAMVLAQEDKKVKKKSSLARVLRKSASALGLGEAAGRAAEASKQTEGTAQQRSPGQLRKKASIFNLAEAFAEKRPGARKGSTLRKRSSALFKAFCSRKGDDG